jgi:hypothetical protein
MRAAYITAFSKTLENLRVEAVPDPIVQRGESKIKICSTGGSLVLPGEEPHHRLEGHSSICGLRPKNSRSHRGRMSAHDSLGRSRSLDPCHRFG